MAANVIVENLTFDPSAGRLAYKDVRYLLIRAETIVGFQKAMEATDEKAAADALYQGGFQGGYLSAMQYKKIHRFSDRQALDFMMRMGTEIGWGQFRLAKFDSQKQALQVIVEKSPFGEAYGRSGRPVCHLITGVISGLASVLFKKECIAREVECLARGDADCVFSVGDSSPPAGRQKP